MADTFEQTTFRAHLLGVVVDHLMKGQITCPHTHQVACELVALLSAYREEDRRLFPEVYLLASSDSDLLPVLAPGVTPLPIGSVVIKPDAESGSQAIARAVLKSCAALAIDGWSVYIRRAEAGFRYGLFRPAAQSYSIGAASVLAHSRLPAVILRNSAENTVEIINSVGGCLEISLTTAPPSKRAMSGQIIEFAQAATLDVPTEQRELATGYLTRVLTDFLRASHGALLAVAPAGEDLDTDRFADAVVFAERVPLVNLMPAAVHEQTAMDVATLRSHESLLRGMIMSDGLTILGTDGSVKAFRVFVHAAPGEFERSKGRPAGGARARAFDVLRECLGAPLVAALYRSQDGRTEVVVR